MVTALMLFPVILFPPHPHVVLTQTKATQIWDDLHCTLPTGPVPKQQVLPVHCQISPAKHSHEWESQAAKTWDEMGAMLAGSCPLSEQDRPWIPSVVSYCILVHLLSHLFLP